MNLRYSITAARPQDLTRLPAIELAAARLLAGHAPESVLNETTSPVVLKEALHEGRLWVALADDVAVGFAHVEVIECETAHLEEIDVDPEHGRRGLGTRLVVQVCDWAAGNGYASVTLTTFRDVPWNMPFYARLGFGIVAPEHLSFALRVVVAQETRRGLDPSRRVVMRRRLQTVHVQGKESMSSRLQNGDLFPDLSFDTVGGRTFAIPRDLAGSYAVVLFYRGSWCPYCCAQLAAFSRAQERLAAAGIAIVALSVDDEATSRALVDRLRLTFPVGFGANADNVAALTGAFVAEGSAYLQSTGFVLDQGGRILTAVYSSGAIGRLVPDDVAGFVKYVDAHRDATQAAMQT